MVTGYDHLLFLLGVIFFLYRLREIGLCVTLFAVGHSATLIGGVLTAAFDGLHGWFWRNRGSDTVVVGRRPMGHYQELKRLP